MKTTYQDLIERLKEGLKQDHPYRGRYEVAEQELSPAAVLLLFGLNRENHAHLLFVRRADHIEIHRGQMAFPGGRLEPSDEGDSVSTALRETEEEVGLLKHQIEVVGVLPHLKTVTGFQIQPVVGVLKHQLGEVSLNLDLDELAEAFWISLTDLNQPSVYSEETLSKNDVEYRICVYSLSQCRIWGATGAMTKNILDRYFQR
jgi:8-oxo-dGTP pyrophosphatase MutT (NUDIX family)